MIVPLLFALLCFAIAGPALIVAVIALHIWLVAVIVQRLCAGRYVRTALWSCILAALVCIDVSCAPASARYDLPQDYLDALRDAVPAAAEAYVCCGVLGTGPANDLPTRIEPATPACNLSMELQGQSLHIVRKACGPDDDMGYFHVSSRTPNCTTRLTGIEQTDHVTYLVFFIDSGTDCDGSTHSQRALQFQLVGGDTLQITNTENY